MERRIRCISSAALLHESCQRNLQDYLRPMANEGDIVWQQMTFEHFLLLRENRRLYLKAYGEYSNYDEMKRQNFSMKYLKNTELKKDITSDLQKAYIDFEKKLFISCWYNSPDLSDVVFNAYAKGSSGIAIGTEVCDLLTQLKAAQLVRDPETSNNRGNAIRNILCANVQYIPQKNMREDELFEPAQVYAPVFMKGLQFKMDHEFRVCVEMESPEELIYNSERNLASTNTELADIAKQINSADTYQEFIEKIEEIEKKYKKFDSDLYEKNNPNHIFLSVAHLQDLIKYIAIKEDSYFQGLGKNLQDVFKKHFKIEMKPDESHKSNGFNVFKVEKIREE